MKQPSTYLVTARANYSDPISFLDHDGKRWMPPEPCFRAFEQIAVVAISEKEAAARYMDEYRPQGAHTVKILTVQYIGPYNFAEHKALRQPIALGA